MPIIGFECDVRPSLYQSFDACIQCAHTDEKLKHGCFNSSTVLKAVASQIRTKHNEITVTELNDCPRAVYLKRTNNYYVKPKTLWYAFKGQMVHSILEAGKFDGDIVEKRFYGSFLTGKYDGISFVSQEISVSGQVDLIRGETLLDWKTTKLIPIKGTPQPHHIKQLSCYRNLVAKQKENPIDIKKAKLVYMDGDSHREMNVELLPFLETDKYIYNNLMRLHDALTKNIEPSFQENYKNKEWAWKCGYTDRMGNFKTYCDVRDLCIKGNINNTVTSKIEENKTRRVVSFNV